MIRIKSRRINKGLTQRHVAAKVNINRTVLSQIESGRVTPRPDELARLAAFFEIPGERLLDHVSDDLVPAGAEARDTAAREQ